MASGEYVSVQSQNESARAEIEVERHELQHNFQAEVDELAQMYVAGGSNPRSRRRSPGSCQPTRDRALAIHAREELGVDPEDLPSPITAALSSMVSFTVGAAIPLAPYALGAQSLALAAILALAALFAAGVVTSRFTVAQLVVLGVPSGDRRRPRGRGHVRSRSAHRRVGRLGPGNDRSQPPLAARSRQRRVPRRRPPGCRPAAGRRRSSRPVRPTRVARASPVDSRAGTPA